MRKMSCTDKNASNQLKNALSFNVSSALTKDSYRVNVDYSFVECLKD